MAPPKPPTAASNTYAAPHSGSETSPTTSPEHSSKQEDSDPNYTPNYEEPLYVLDEPLAGVDPLARDYLLELIRTLRSPEAPLLLSTHLINGVDSIFNEIVLISDGRLLTHDSADNLRALGDGDLELAYKRSVSGR